MKKRTTDLFRFATMRSPDLITPERKKLGFIEHPSPINSHFLSNLNPEDDLEIRRTIVISLISSFNPFKNVSEIKNIKPELWQFSQWLLSEKNRLDVELIPEKIVGTEITDLQLYSLWDNFFYDVLVKKNRYIRQASIQMIVAHNFIVNYEKYISAFEGDENKIEQQAKDIRRLANAKIMIGEEFAISKTIDFSTNFYSTLNSDKQQQVHENFVAQLPIEYLQNILEQLTYVKSEHITITKKNFEAELKKFTLSTSKVVSDYLKANPNIIQKIVVKDTTSFIEKRESINLDQDTEIFQRDSLSSIENLIPESITPNFNFEPEKPLSISFLRSLDLEDSKLSDFLRTNKLLEKPIEDVRGLIEKEIDNKERLQSQFIRTSFKEILINGVSVKKKDFTALDFALSYYSIDVNGNVKSGDPNAIYLSLNTGVKGAFFEELSYKFTANEFEYESSKFQLIPNNGNQLFVKLAIGRDKESLVGETLTEIPKDIVFVFEATFKLNNGNSYKIYKKAITSINLISGIAIPMYRSGSEVELYGVYCARCTYETSS